MSNVIDLLERLGNDARLRHASDAELEQELVGANVDPQIREAILLRDQRRLEELLGADANVCCMIYAPAREDEDDDEPKPEDDSEDDDQEKSLRQRAR